MKELELKEMMARHKQELVEKDITIGSVSQPWFFCFWRAVVGCIGRELSAFENTEFNWSNNHQELDALNQVCLCACTGLGL